MNRSLARCIVNFLRVGPSTKLSCDFLRQFELCEWEKTLAWLDDSGLALYLLERLKDSGCESALPTALRARLEHNLVTNRLRVAAMTEEFETLNRRFEEAGVEYAVLKGFSLIPEYCPDGALRSQSDYDYLIGPDCVEPAQTVLESAGYLKRVPQGPWTDRPTTHVFSKHPSCLTSDREDFYSHRVHRPVELHLALWESHHDRICLNLPEGALARRRIRKCHGVRFYALDDDDALIFQVLHAFQHMLAYWCRPSCFLEIARFLEIRGFDRSFWERFAGRTANAADLQEIAGLVFLLATKLFGGQLQGVRSVGRPLPAALSLWVERYGRDWAFESFPGSKLSLFLHREFVPDKAAWRQIHCRRLFPVHRPNRVCQVFASRTRILRKPNWDQWLYVLGRLKFHAAATLRYGFEYPRWQRLLRRSADRQTDLCHDNVLVS